MPITRRSAKAEEAIYEEPDDAPVEEAPRGRRRGPASAEAASKDDAKPTLHTGWAGYKKVKDETGSGFATEFKFPDDGEMALVKFLDDEPFVSYAQHWLNEFKGKKSYVCGGEDCPLCDIGNEPAPRAAFNIMEIPEGGGAPVLKVIVLGVKAGTQLKSYADNPRMGPLTKHYWALSKSGAKQQVAYNFQLVKAADLEEEWETKPLTDAAIEKAEAKAYDHETFPTRSTMKQLEDIAEAVSS